MSLTRVFMIVCLGSQEDSLRARSDQLNQLPHGESLVGYRSFKLNLHPLFECIMHI